MDVSTSASFSSPNGTPDKKGATIGDSTLYDSALDHQISGNSAYKSFNGSRKRSGSRGGGGGNHEKIFQRQRLLIETLSQVLPNSNHFGLCMRWLKALARVRPDQMPARYRLVQEMERQLIENGRLGAPFTKDTKDFDAKLRELLGDQKPSAHHENQPLRESHLELRREVIVHRLKLAVLQIQTRYRDQRLQRRRHEVEKKTDFRDKLESTVMAGGLRALELQDPATFPKGLLTTIFACFGGDAKFSQHCAGMDYQLKCIVDKMCANHNGRDMLEAEETVKRKVRALKEKLIQKYDKQLEKQAQSQQEYALTMKTNCFSLLAKYLSDNFSEPACRPDYINFLRGLYEQEISKVSV